MPDKIQVIRVDEVEDGPGADAVTVWITDIGDNSWGAVVPKASVIELTDERERALGSSGPRMRRLVGEWTATDA